MRVLRAHVKIVKNVGLTFVNNVNWRSDGFSGYVGLSLAAEPEEELGVNFVNLPKH